MSEDNRLPLIPEPTRIFGAVQPETIKKDSIDNCSDNQWLILITGKGGMGKTRRLRDLRKLLEEDKTRIVAPLVEKDETQLYDFYHIDYFKASAIEDAIIAVLEEKGANFSRYKEARKALESARDDDAMFLDKQQAVREAFIEDYSAFASAQPQHIILIFDTVEQSVPLTDEAELMLVQPQRDASAGGYFWLNTMLPKLQHTIAVLGGREEVLYGKAFPLYVELKQAMPHEEFQVGELNREDTTQFAREAIERQRSEPLPDTELEVLYLVSGGVPFWIDVFLTMQRSGFEPESTIDELFKQVRSGSAPDRLSEDDQDRYRDALSEGLLGVIGPTKRSLMLPLQCMASLRKGVTRDMLQYVAKRYEPEFDVDSIWEELKKLMIVKKRDIPKKIRTTESESQDTTLLFLHDEMYHWFDRHERSKEEADVTEAIIKWYEDRIKELEEQRSQRTLELLQHEPLTQSELVLIQDQAPDNEQRVEAYKKIKEDQERILRRQEQYRLEQLHYRYQNKAGDEAGKKERSPDLVPATHTYNLLAYEAILGRDIGTSITLRQEALQNSYRLLGSDTLPPFVQAECAARWLLRIAYNDVKPYADDPLATIKAARSFTDTDQLGDSPKEQLARSLMDLTEANFLIEKVGVAEQGERIEACLTAAEARLDLIKKQLKSRDSGEEQQKRDGSGGNPTQLWRIFLSADIYTLRGFLARQQYNLPIAIKNYREAYKLARSKSRLKQQQAEIVNNLAFALSEQGLVDEAHELAQEALRIRLQYASQYELALSRNTLARIEIRAGQPALAYQFALQASKVMQDINSVRGRFMTQPVLAETQRKLAEQLSHAPAQQDALFDQAIKLLEEIAEDMRERRYGLRERWREVYQNLGCTYRSKALARQNRLDLFEEKYEPESDDELSDMYRWAAVYLKLAYAALNEQGDDFRSPDLDALAKQAFAPPKLEPTLKHDVFLVDILEDLAVIFVNADVYDPRLEKLLKAAEQHAPSEYHITSRGRIRNLLTSEAIRGYWRELGQIELQRTLASFGKYEFGVFDQPDDPAMLYGGNEQNRREKELQEDYLHKAVYHMIRMIAYLLHYDPEAPMLKRIRQLVLRELTNKKDIIDRLRGLADDQLLDDFKLGDKVETAVRELFDLAKQRAEMREAL